MPLKSGWKIFLCRFIDDKLKAVHFKPSYRFARCICSYIKFIPRNDQNLRIRFIVLIYIKKIIYWACFSYCIWNYLLFDNSTDYIRFYLIYAKICFLSSFFIEVFIITFAATGSKNKEWYDHKNLTYPFSVDRYIFRNRFFSNLCHS